MLNRKIFRAYDIRGIAHVPASNQEPDLTPEGMEQIGKASGTYFLRNGMSQIAVGHDPRLSNPELANAFIKGLLSTGCNVHFLGMVPTPMLYFASCAFDQIEGGACITASHNPKEYNGVKLVAKGAHSICGEALQEIYDLIEAQDYETGEGTSQDFDVYPHYEKALLERVKLARPLKVVVDAGNGATAPYIEPFFKALGCELIPMYTEPDGRFPNHPANPEELENMQDLIASVRENNADIGIAFDGDGDRVGVVDENGHHYNADWLLILLARDLLFRQQGAKVVFDVKVSQLLIDDIEKHGGVPVMTKTGHSFIESKMHEVGAPLGGEISGHMFFAENYYGFDDAFLGAAKLLQILSEAEHGFSEFFKDLPHTATTPEIKCGTPDDRKFEIVKELTEHFTQLYECSTIDGVRINFDEASWGAVRCSNTSPNLTVRFEAPNEERLKEIAAIMKAELEKYPEVNLDKWIQ